MCMKPIFVGAPRCDRARDEILHAAARKEHHLVLRITDYTDWQCTGWQHEYELLPKMPNNRKYTGPLGKSFI